MYIYLFIYLFIYLLFILKESIIERAIMKFCQRPMAAVMLTLLL